MESQIMSIIENEVNRRVSDRLSNVVQHVSRTYRLPYDKLMKDVASLEDTRTDQCLGLVQSGKRCTRHARIDGYCKGHVHQKPLIVMRPLEPDEVGPVHTHTLPPMFLAGCPACERFKSVKNLGLF